MKTNVIILDFKTGLLSLFFSIVSQLLIGALVWQLSTNIDKANNENKLNLSLMIPLEVEEQIVKEKPHEILHLPELEEIKPEIQEMTVDEILPVDPFEIPRLMEEPVVPKVEPAPKKKKVIRKEAPKIVQPEKKEITAEVPKEPVKEEINVVPVSISTPVPVKEIKQVPQVAPKPTLTKLQLNENSKYLAKVMKVFEKNKIYPSNARATHTEGKIIVSFCIDKNGYTNNVVAKTKNPKILATAAEELVRKSRLPTPPKHWETSSHIELPITYRLR